MKVLHFGTLNSNAGGPAMSSYLTIKGLRSLGIDAQISMFALPEKVELWGSGIPINFCKPPLENKFCYSRFLKRELEAIQNVDIYHAQGVWQYPTYALIDISRRKGSPYVITPRGMLYPQDIVKSNRIAKHLSLRWRLLKDLNSAACIHTTCEEEMRICREFGVLSPIAVIPNPMEKKKYPIAITPKVFTLGYIGRFSKRKNIESLIHAFAAIGLKRSEAELLIIGGGDERYEKFLKNEAQRLHLDNVTFTGFLSGKEKEQALSRITVLAMPRQDLVNYNCGWWVDYDQNSIEEAVLEAVNTPMCQLREMGDNGKILVAGKYSVESVANQMASLYSWILNKREKPSFVFL